MGVPRPLHLSGTVLGPWGRPSQRSPGSCAPQHPSGNPEFWGGPKNAYPPSPADPAVAPGPTPVIPAAQAHSQTLGAVSSVTGKLPGLVAAAPGPAWGSPGWDQTPSGRRGVHGTVSTSRLALCRVWQRGSRDVPQPDSLAPAPQSPGAQRKGSRRGRPGPPPVPLESRDGLNCSPWVRTPRERPWGICPGGTRSMASCVGSLFPQHPQHRALPVYNHQMAAQEPQASHHPMTA